MSSFEVLTVPQEQMTLDLLLWRRFKQETPGLVEKVYELNPGIASLGMFLPVGTKVTVEIPEQKTAAVTRVRRLY